MATPTLDAQTTPSHGRWALAVAVVALGAAAATWRLWEQDVFWQVRAGRELIATWHWPTVDTWSYTAAGGPWHNFQWLSTLLVAAAERMGGIAGLVLLRDGAVALLLGLALMYVRPVRQRWLATAMVGLLWLCCARRFQVRSDFFVTLVFAGLLAADLSPWSWRVRRLTFVGLVVLAANLHPGTAPFVQLAALACIARDKDARSWRREALPIAGVLAGLFVTPYHVHVLPYLWQHLFYAAYQAVPNPDHQPLMLASSWSGRNALGPGAWLVLMLAAGVLAVRRLRSLDRAAVLREGATLALLALLAGLTLNRDRVLPYAAILAVASIGRSWPQGQVARHQPLVHAGLAALVWLVAIPLWLSRPAVQFGLGLDARLHPVGAAGFIAKHGLRPQILHFQGEGNYLLYALPDFPVFLDTRESMYASLGPVYRDMVNDPNLMTAVMDRYQVNTVLLPERFLLTPWRDGTSRRAAFFPKRNFALVYFDQHYVLLARRIPEHAALIAAHEYEYLLPYRDPTAYLSTQDRTPESDHVFQREVERCRREVPNLSHCQVAASALSRP